MLPLAPEHDIDGRKTRVLPLDYNLGRPYKPRPTWDSLLLQPLSPSCGEQSTKATGCETLGLRMHTWYVPMTWSALHRLSG